MIEKVMRTSEMQDGVFHLKDFDQAMDRYYDAGKPVWGARTENEPFAGVRKLHWVELPLGLTVVQSRQAVKVAVEAKTGQRVRMRDIVYDP